MNRVGYSFNAGHYCEKCTYDYARKVPFSEYVFPEGVDETDLYDSRYSMGIINLATAIELEVIRDGENNPIHPIFDDDKTDTPEHCCVCHKYLDTDWTDECLSYVHEALGTYIESQMYGTGEGGDPEVLDTWAEHYVNYADHSAVTVMLYKALREWEED